MSWWKVILNGVLSALHLAKKEGKFEKGQTPERYVDVRDKLR